MRTIDKIIFALLGISAVLLIAYGITTSTGFVIAITGSAIKIASLGTYFWGVMLVILLTLLILLRVRSKTHSKK